MCVHSPVQVIRHILKFWQLTSMCPPKHVWPAIIWSCIKPWVFVIYIPTQVKTKLCSHYNTFSCNTLCMDECVAIEFWCGSVRLSCVCNSHINKCYHAGNITYFPCTAWVLMLLPWHRYQEDETYRFKCVILTSYTRTKLSSVHCSS